MEEFEIALESVLSFFLMFSDDTVILPLVVVGFIWIDRDLFYHGACIVLTSMVINFSLKLTFYFLLYWMFGIDDLSFPSGHMLSSVAFYGWIGYYVSSTLLRLGIILLLGAIGCGLIYNDYHDYTDILGAILFAMILLIQYIRHIPASYGSWPLNNILITSSSILLLYIATFHGLVPKFIWLAYYALWGFVIGEVYFLQYKVTTLYSKAIATTIGMSIIIIFYFMSQALLDLAIPAYIAQLSWLVIACAPALSCYLQHKLHCSTVEVE